MRTIRQVYDVSMPPEAISMPNPGEELMLRVAGTPDLTWFFWSGRQSVRELERTLAIVGRSLDSFESILDFGCGCGRMLLWMEELAETHGLHGTDIDADAVTWCREHIPYARVSVNEADPPLAYPDGAFDLVFNHSVFTHLDERRQDQWLTELRRVTRGGGFVILSTTGEVGLPQVALPQDAEVLRDRLEREGIAFLSGSFPPDFPLPDWYQNTLHAPWYVFEHWGRWFDIRGYVPGAALGLQDHVLLQRRPDGDRPRVPLAARPLRTEQEGFERRAVAALAGTRANRAAAAVAPPRFGVAGKFARRLALRAMRPYSAHEDSFDDAVAATIVELARATDHHAALLRALDKQTQTDGQPP